MMPFHNLRPFKSERNHVSFNMHPYEEVSCIEHKVQEIKLVPPIRDVI
jgi:hypothetical protein